MVREKPLIQQYQISVFQRFARLGPQLLRRNPFHGDIIPNRVPLFSFASNRPTLPFPHPWNYQKPIQILDTYFWDAESNHLSGRHNRFLDVPWFSPVLVTRDPSVIRAISTATGDRPGQFDRDTLPSRGIARATGEDSLLYANGPSWKRQKKIANPAFARTTLFQPERFGEFADSFRQTVVQRIDALERLIEHPSKPVRVELEPEIKAVMLELLVNNFFGASIPYNQIRERYVPGLDCVIEHIVRDSVVNVAGCPLHRIPSFSNRIKKAKEASAIFEELTDLALAGRKEGRGLWAQFKSEAPDSDLRSNIRVFLAGALEATTSYTSWAIAHLARHPEVQERVFLEVHNIVKYTPETLGNATYLRHVLDETLRLTPSLYFHPRRATMDTWIETSSGQRMRIPAGTHILMDVWHANRHEDHWGVQATGYPAIDFVPERWERLGRQGKDNGDFLHFGFGHGPRFCPGKSLGQMEVALVVGTFVKLFRFNAVNVENPERASVSTKPQDGVMVDLALRS
tara:strand:- start:694 stop:2235 length:1542 start_codon:yes stop_codon:yes gene_type:complete